MVCSFIIGLLLGLYLGPDQHSVFRFWRDLGAKTIALSMGAPHLAPMVADLTSQPPTALWPALGEHGGELLAGALALAPMAMPLAMALHRR